MLFWQRCSIKINLALAVGGLSDDGYHSVETIFWRVPSPETLAIRVTGQDMRIYRYGRPFGGEHIVASAARLLRTHGCTLPGLEVECTKYLPAGSGVGAGSGNAAAFLSWAAQMGYTSMNPADSVALGSDVPFLFSRANLAVAKGRGEILEPVACNPKLRGVMAFPKWSAGTADMYRRLDVMRQENRCAMSDFSKSREIVEHLAENRRFGMWHNDFLPVAESMYREYHTLWDASERCGALAWGLCGSGSAAAAVFPKSADISEAAMMFADMPFIDSVYVWGDDNL